MTETTGKIAAFLRELRKRRVYQAAGIYAAVAFVAAQAADLVVAALHLPHWLFTATVVVGILGFPVAVVLAWAFDVTTSGVAKAAPVAATGAGVPVTLPRLVLLGVILLSTGAAGYAALAHVRAPAETVERSLAVLPFINLAASEDEDYFSDGLTEDVLTTLARVGEIRVISRTSVMPYKGTEKTVREIADELGVAYVLSGSVRRDRGRVRVSVQLVDPRRDEHLWAERYDRELVEIFDIKADIAQRIAMELGARLGREERRRIAAPSTHDPVAYDLLLRSRDYAARLRPEDHDIAIELARGAMERDPGFAEAYAVLSTHYSGRVAFYGAPTAWLDSAVVLAGRAIAIDPHSASGHGALGRALLVAGRYDEGITAMERAVSLDPSDGAHLNNLGVAHGIQGRYDEVVYWVQRALNVDPARADRLYHNLAVVYTDLGMYSDAEHAIDRARRLRPDYWALHAIAIDLALYTGDLARALAEADALRDAQPANARALLHAGEAYLHASELETATRLFEEAYALAPTALSTFAYAPIRLASVRLQSGERERAELLLDEFDSFAAAELAAGNRSRALQLALGAAAALRGDATTALEHVEAAIDAGWVDTALLRIDPLFAPLRDMPAFRAMLARVDESKGEMQSRLQRRRP